MRKTLWGCAAAALAALGAGYLAWDYGCDHPGSWLGHGVSNAEKAAATQVRAMEAGRRTAEVTLTAVAGLVSQTAGAVSHEKGNQPPAAEVCPAAPALLPGAVVLREDDAELPLQAMPPVREFAGAGEECEEATMPAVPEDAATMPGCAEESSRPPAKTDTAPAAEMPGCHETKAVPAESCPRTGHHRARPQTPPVSEDSEPVFPKMDRDGGEKPAHPEVDTMEVRPGDLWFLDYTGPF